MLDPTEESDTQKQWMQISSDSKIVKIDIKYFTKEKIDNTTEERIKSKYTDRVKQIKEMYKETKSYSKEGKCNTLKWAEIDSEYAAREMARSVKHISESADLLSREHLLLSLNSMPRLAGTKGAPKMEQLLKDLVALGHSAARYPDMDPMFITDADFQTVLDVVRKYHN